MSSSPLQFPGVYIFGFLLDDEERHELEIVLDKIGALRHTIQEADVGLTKIPTKRRVEFELRKLKFITVDVTDVKERLEQSSEVNSEVKEAVGKKRKAGHDKTKRTRKSTLNKDGKEVIDLSSSDEEDDEDEAEEKEEMVRKKLKSADGISSPASIKSKYGRDTLKLQDDLKVPRVFNVTNTFKVLKIDWYYDSLKEGILLPWENYLIYEGRRTMEPPKFLPSDILTRAAADPQSYPNHSYNHHHRHQQSKALTRPTLLTETTSEHDDPEYFPPLPEYLKTNRSCERPTPLNSPNDDFINQLKTIKLKRLLEGDTIGNIAYGASIASIAAYPYPLTSPQEITRLPGCDLKIANLFLQYKNTNMLEEVEEFESDPRMQVLHLFWNIWGVADKTARAFYNRGWRDLDDIILHGWETLTRVQQIGVKYYDEFLSPIPRPEVESIASVVLSEATKIDEGYQMVIVGGYRRGKNESGDVDIILTHPDESKTLGFLPVLTERLEDLGWITHILLESLANTERGQRAVEVRGDDQGKKHTGFDTLDKALVVWQDINYAQPSPAPQSPSHPSSPSPSPSQTEPPPTPKNPNPHRRVDIILTPWKTAGVAIIGWSGGTTFQRDLRKHVKEKKNWKFDSSGIRDRGTGEWIDLEGDVRGYGEGVLREKEMAVFRGVGLEWREPWERCTG